MIAGIDRGTHHVLDRLERINAHADVLAAALHVVKCVATLERAARYASHVRTLRSMEHRRARLVKIRGALTRAVLHFGDCRAIQGPLS